MAQQNKETKRSRNTNGTNKNQKNKSKGKNELKKAAAEISDTAIYGKITPEKPQKSKKSGAKKSEKSKSQKSNSSKKQETKKSTKSNKSTTSKKSGGKTKNKITQPVRIISLGGLEEIGKNITLYECGEDIIIVDCGMAFPDDDLPGIDIVIPDFSYIVKNIDRVKGLFITHGHEDHIGAIPYLLKEVSLPIYGTRLTLGLVEGKLKEHGIQGDLRVCSPSDHVKAGCFDVEFIHVNHSIPDAVGFAISCPGGVYVHTGDFKIDSTPIDGDVMNLARLSELGKQGVTMLLVDSTNAERPGFTPSERVVGGTFENLFSHASNKRIIVATFSSNIHRIQQIIDEAVRCKRKVAVLGRSMINVVSVASELGYLNVPDGVLISIDMIRKYRPEEIVIITTGSQGEPMSALHRMAFSDHRNVDIGPSDLIIISATPIPGNEKTVSRVVNELMKQGAEVIYERMYDVHVSGHACAEEIKLIQTLTKPKYYMPLHGEYKHLVKNAKIAQSMGMDKKNIVIAQIGNVVEVSESGVKIIGSVPSGRMLVDGYGVGDVGNIVLKDRKHLAEDGLIVAVMTIDSVSGDILAGPDIVTRGFVYVRESEELIDEARRVICNVLDSYRGRDWPTIKQKVRDELSRYLYEKTKRSPMILPIIMEI
ncbi:MAG: ribonuclease J [Clostridia bacterium]|nr:ribonuclease J [Clostridia bacterium]MBQ3563131.1 ribonuclease J [Clostridia bacterium]